MPQISKLRQLADIISQQVDALETHMAKLGLEYPDLDVAMELPPSPADVAAISPDVMKMGTLIAAACGHLSAIVKPAPLSLIDGVQAFHMSACIRAASSLNVVEILRTAGPAGLHIDEIAAQTKQNPDPQMIARILRLLATNHVFREVTPNVFANNRISSIPDTGKSLETLHADGPQGKWKNAHGLGAGMAALLEHTDDEVFKSAAYLTEALTNKGVFPFNQAFPSAPSFFEWLEEPNNEVRKARFEVAMEGTTLIEPSEAILHGFDWTTLPDSAIVVDVGGGTGHTIASLSKEHKGRLRYVIQDRAKVIESAQEYWNSKDEPYPDRKAQLSSGIVKLQGHDFFTPQPIKDAAVFIVRGIVHDWPDNLSTEILHYLRQAAMPSTKLIMIEQVVPHACPDTTEATNVDGFTNTPVPEPLLANLGKGNTIPYWFDMVMHNILNGRERTVADFVILAQSAGWKLVKFYDVQGSALKQLVAIPM